MATITVRDIEDEMTDRLRARAAEHGRSVEEEVRQILRAALDRPCEPKNLMDSIRSRVEPIGGIDLALPPREPMREPPRFD
jgi:plasmid stability protein